MTSVGSVPMFVGDAQAGGGVGLVVHLDDHGRLVTLHGGIVTGRDVDDRGRVQLDDAPIGILEAERAMGEEAGVSVAARVRADQGPEIGGPTQSDRVDRPLDTGITHSNDVDLNRPECLVLGARYGSEDRQVGVHTRTLPRLTYDPVGPLSALSSSARGPFRAAA